MNILVTCFLASPFPSWWPFPIEGNLHKTAPVQPSLTVFTSVTRSCLGSSGVLEIFSLVIHSFNETCLALGMVLGSEGAVENKKCAISTQKSYSSMGKLIKQMVKQCPNTMLEDTTTIPMDI